MFWSTPKYDLRMELALPIFIGLLILIGKAPKQMMQIILLLFWLAIGASTVASVVCALFGLRL